jgi:hypothetical protein
MPSEGAGECLVELDERWRDLRRATGWLARELREVEGDTGAAARRA